VVNRGNAERQWSLVRRVVKQAGVHG